MIPLKDFFKGRAFGFSGSGVRFGVISVRGLGLLERVSVEFRVYKELSAVGPPPKRVP